ncbi:hypothetical protein SCLCIDRAFT_589597 [Scleroderma citrinum Foug A]|uniref:Uncharacterized protein n=1 Tax=Scleroderma citrinum Foug A TaxID=1036808 RepID=A0A0C2ZT79_9AGAM|nr:hypothetical protein SCLCIDRAFT_589597 [Scleroderma citrinum Foug A]
MWYLKSQRLRPRANLYQHTQYYHWRHKAVLPTVLQFRLIGKLLEVLQNIFQALALCSPTWPPPALPPPRQVLDAYVALSRSQGKNGI